MELNEAIFTRRSIRLYQDRPISDEDLREILEAGVAAPSGVNLQPWYFVAIRSEEQLEKLRSVMDEVAERILPGLQRRFANHPSVIAETTNFVQKLGGAPACILAFHLKPDYAYPGNLVDLSIAAAIENILLTAKSKGIGSCWLLAPVEAEVGDLLRDIYAPGKGRLVSLLTLGYPAQEPKAPPRKDGRYCII